MLTDRLSDAARSLLSTAAERAVDVAVERVEGLADRLGDVSENGGAGLKDALSGGDGGGNPISGALSRGASAVTDRVKGAIGISTDGSGDSDHDSGGAGGGSGGSGAGGNFKFMNIVESADVGVPVRVAYNQWTQFADFPSFMKKVETVDARDPR